jgi:sensor histidine kinase regulating citrate/malate metabolism
MFATTACCVLAMIYAIEANWMKQSALHTQAQQRESQLLLQSQELYKSSLTGDNARLIAHEVDNMITAINFVTNNPKDIDVKSIKLSLGYVKNACDLILREQKSHYGTNTVAQLLKDIDLLIRKQAEGQGIAWSIVCQPELENLCFQERQGSAYFIVQNFVKNATRSIKIAQQRRGKIQITIEREAAAIIVTVHDNGTGIDDDTKEKLLSGRGKDVESKNHGIGSQFVHRECQFNQFEWVIATSTLPEFVSAVGIRIPLMING